MSDKRPSAKLGRPARASGEKHTKEKLLDAAVDLFARQGYDRTSLRQIAGAVGITESAVYRHYPSKEAILDEIIAYTENAVVAPLEEFGPGTGRSLFMALLLPLPKIILSDPYLARITRIMYAEMHHNERIREYLREGQSERSVDALEALLRQQSELGAIRGCDFRALARVINSFRYQWIYETFILDQGKELEVSALERDLLGPIELFESLFALGEAKP